jgi:hypothetical protein
MDGGQIARCKEKSRRTTNMAIEKSINPLAIYMIYAKNIMMIFNSWLTSPSEIKFKRCCKMYQSFLFKMDQSFLFKMDQPFSFLISTVNLCIVVM